MVGLLGQALIFGLDHTVSGPEVYGITFVYGLLFGVLAYRGGRALRPGI